MSAPTEVRPTNGHTVPSPVDVALRQLAPVPATQPVLTEADVQAAEHQVELQKSPAIREQWTSADLDEVHSLAEERRRRERELELALHEATLEQQRQEHQAQLAEAKAKAEAERATRAILHAAEQERARAQAKHSAELAKKGSDLELFEAEVAFEDHKLNSPRARRAAWAKEMQAVNKVGMVGLVAAIAMTAIFVQEGIEKKFPQMGELALIASYGMETIFSVGLVLLLMITTARAKRGYAVNWKVIVPIEASIVLVSIVMAVTPRLAAGMGWSAWLFALPPLGVTVMLGVHVYLTQANISEARTAAEEARTEHVRALQILDAEDIKLAALAEHAFGLMEAGVLRPSMDADGGGVPSATALATQYREQKVSKAMAIRLRDMMRLRANSPRMSATRLDDVMTSVSVASDQ